MAALDIFGPFGTVLGPSMTIGPSSDIFSLKSFSFFQRGNVGPMTRQTSGAAEQNNVSPTPTSGTRRKSIGRQGVGGRAANLNWQPFDFWKRFLLAFGELGRAPINGLVRVLNEID